MGLVESGRVNVQAMQLGHHDLSMFAQIFDPDDLKQHE